MHKQALFQLWLELVQHSLDCMLTVEATRKSKMKKHINDEHHNKHLSQPRPGLKRQEFNSYEIVDGCLRKETIVRTFFDDGIRYTDSSTTVTIAKCL